ncbi:MAG: hypothetical protein EXR35_08800 [Limnohabitans sp.]|nr:hypothetical protein [Limnohabitans sp.]
MKSIIFRQPGGPEVLEWIDQPEPVAALGQVVIRAHAMAVNMPNILIRKGLYKWSPPLPANPGNELAGVIESVGAGVSEYSIGQRVLLSARELPVRGGCYTEKIAVPATSIHALPDNVDFEQAVVIPTYLVAHAMLNGLGLRIFNIHTFDHQQSVLRQLTRELIQLLAQKKINSKIGARFALADAAQAHRLFESGSWVRL